MTTSDAVERVATPEAAVAFLTVAEAAASLRVSPPTIYRAIASGRLRAIRVGPHAGPLRIAVDKLEDFLTVAATSGRE